MTAQRCLLLLLLVAHAVEASADNRREVAQALVREGNSFLDRRACEEALERFRRAQRVYPESYRVEVNLGSAHECLGDLPAAVTRFERFLSRAQPRRDGEMIRALRARFDRARAKVAGVRLSCTVSGATVFVDGSAAGTTPLLHAIYLAPGVHRLRLAKEGLRPFERRLQLAAGSLEEVTVLWRASLAVVAPLPRTPPSPPRAEAPQFYKRWWFWTIIGVAVAGATVGGILGARVGGEGRLVGEAGTIDLSRP